jgi:hypothetical protein
MPSVNYCGAVPMAAILVARGAGQEWRDDAEHRFMMTRHAEGARP